MLPSNKKQILEQAKFTYSPLGKVFEKQIKTIEDQEEKQIKAINNQGQIKTIKKYAYSDKDGKLISKQKEIFNKLVDERLDGITQQDEKVNTDDLICKDKGQAADTKFKKFDNALSLIDKIKEVEISLADAQNDHKRFKSELDEIKKGNKKKIKGVINTFYNIEMLYKAKNNVIKFYDDYSSMVSEAKHKATKGTGLKISTPKQMLKRLPIALEQKLAGNNSENVLNEMRQIAHSLNQSKKNY